MIKAAIAGIAALLSFSAGALAAPDSPANSYRVAQAPGTPPSSSSSGSTGSMVSGGGSGTSMGSGATGLGADTGATLAPGTTPGGVAGGAGGVGDWAGAQWLCLRGANGGSRLKCEA